MFVSFFSKLPVYPCRIKSISMFVSAVLSIYAMSQYWATGKIKLRMLYCLRESETNQLGPISGPRLAERQNLIYKEFKSCVLHMVYRKKGIKTKIQWVSMTYCVPAIKELVDKGREVVNVIGSH